jgi:formylglycine-generating enzyme required for sulfatase activity
MRMRQDCPWIPELVRLPPGQFLMGSPHDEVGRLDVEGPQHLVTIEGPFAIGRCPVTVDQFAAFVAESGYGAGTTCRQWTGADWEERPGSFRSPGFAQAGDHPAVCVSWEDAQAYVRWLSSRSGLPVRLPSEAEWEYAARAGTTTPYWWGSSIAPQQANFKASATGDGSSHQWPQQTLPVHNFEPNPWGIYQVHGNIWEWVEDGWSPSYAGAPHDGSARQEATSSKRGVRGGSWLNGPRGVRSARRHAAEPGLRRSDIGFRIAAAIAP